MKYDSTGRDSTLAYCALISALKEMEAPRDVAYPVPCDDHLTIKNSGSNLSAVLYDLSGKAQLDILFSPMDRERTINTSHLPEGVYFLRLQSGEATLGRKVIVSHSGN